jgi:hypothetical protein
MLRMAATIMGSNIQAHCLRPCPPSKCSSTRRRSFSGLGRRSRPSTSSLGFEFAPYSGCALVEREVYFAAIGGEQVDHLVASLALVVTNGSNTANHTTSAQLPAPALPFSLAAAVHKSSLAGSVRHGLVGQADVGSGMIDHVPVRVHTKVEPA